MIILYLTFTSNNKRDYTKRKRKRTMRLYRPIKIADKLIKLRKMSY